jgi:hypothetical protein
MMPLPLNVAENAEIAFPVSDEYPAETAATPRKFTGSDY